MAGESIIKIDVRTFFDRPKVLALASRSTVSAIRRIVGRIWRTARNSLRPRKAASAPGSPPSLHTGWFKDKILFGMESTNPPAGIVGVAPGVRQVDSGGRRMHALHEFGGSRRLGAERVIFFDRVKRTWVIRSGKEIGLAYMQRAGGRRRYIPMSWMPEAQWSEARVATGYTESGRAVFPARPFFRPALQKNIPWIRENFPRLFNEVWVQGGDSSFRQAMAA